MWRHRLRADFPPPSVMCHYTTFLQKFQEYRKGKDMMLIQLMALPVYTNSRSIAISDSFGP